MLTVTFALVAASCFFAAGGGLGGGALLVPIYLAVLGVEARIAVGLSNLTIAAGALASLMVNIRRRHPVKQGPLIDWWLVLMLEPLTILGAMVGSYVNKVQPSWLTTLALSVMLLVMMYILAHKGCLQYKLESEQLWQQGTGTASAVDTELGHCGSARGDGADEEEEVVAEDTPLLLTTQQSNPTRMPTSAQHKPRILYEGSIHATSGRGADEQGGTCSTAAADAAGKHLGRGQKAGAVVSGQVVAAAPPPQVRVPSLEEELQLMVGWSPAFSGQPAPVTVDCSGYTTANTLPACFPVRAASQPCDALGAAVFDKASSDGSSGCDGSAHGGANECGAADQWQIKSQAGHKRGVVGAPSPCSVASADSAAERGMQHAVRSYSAASGTIITFDTECLRSQSALQVGRPEPQLPLGRVAVLLMLFIAVLATDIGKQAVTCGTWLYWCITFLILPITVTAWMGGRRMLLRRMENTIGAGEGDVNWTSRNSIVYPLCSTAAGLIAGMFGVGGGMVKGPLMLHLGVLPDVAAATSSTMILFTAASSSVVYASFGSIPQQLGWIAAVTGFVASFAGQVALNLVVKRMNRRSLIVFTMVLFMAVAVVVVSVQAVLLVIAAVRQDDLWKAGTICKHSLSGD